MPVQAEVLEETVDAVETDSPSLLGVVKVKESNDTSWKETADVVSVSSTGAGFYVSRACQVGRLVALVVPLEPHLRCYDHQKELYAVHGLVQHCQMISSGNDAGYHVGVAFIGKHAPKSFREDPTQSYRICGMDEDGLWKITEAAKDFKPRKDARFYEAIDHYLAIVDAQKTTLKGERATTENISKSGAAVLSSLDVHVGDRVKFISEKYDFSGLAVVCNRKDCKDGRARLHLQFVENTFPVESIVVRKAVHAEEEVLVN